MKYQFLTATVLSVLAGGAIAASDFIDTAQVISAKPKIARVTEKRQDCDPAATPAPAPTPKKESNMAGTILGGIAGGLLGHEVGGGSGRTVATIIGATGGAVAGSMIGDRSSTSAVQNTPLPAPQQCSTIETSREVVEGYDVVYRYNGRDVSVVLPSNPGITVKVAISAVVDEPPMDAPRRGTETSAPRGAEVKGRHPREAQGGNYQYRY